MSDNDEYQRSFPADWYDDGTGTGNMQWWDGQQWTEHRSGPAAPAAYDRPPGRSRMNQQPLGYRVALGALIAVIIGSFGPWATLGAFSLGGMERDGLLTFVIALVGLACLARYMVEPSRVLMIFCAIIAILLVAITIYDLIDISGLSVEFLGSVIEPSVGWGLWLAAAGSLTFAGGLIAGNRQNDAVAAPR